MASAAKKTGELSFNVQGATKTISLFDEATGDMMSTYDVFGEISKSWDKMTNSEKQALAINLAGKVVLARSKLI